MKKPFPFYRIGYVFLFLLVLLYFVPVKIDTHTESAIWMKGFYVLSLYLTAGLIAIREIIRVVRCYFSDGDELLRRFSIIRFVIVFGLCLFVLYFNYVCFDLSDFFRLLHRTF